MEAFIALYHYIASFVKPPEAQKQEDKMNKKKVKTIMQEKGVGIRQLSGNRIFLTIKLTYILYCPWTRVKLSQAIYISKMLGIKISDLI